MTLLRRVVSYGDDMKPTQIRGDPIGFEVVEEGRVPCYG